MRIIENRRGQFIIIAVMMIALMIVSIGAVMFGSRTYYRYEQWEEYFTLTEHLRLSTTRLVEISLANYTASGDVFALRSHLARWQSDLSRAYPGHGILLTHELANGTDMGYYQGLAYRWNESVSYSAANATFVLDIASTGLEAYRFTTTVFLSLRILDVDTANNQITVAVTREDGMPVNNLKEDNFLVDGHNIENVAPSYDPDYSLKYTIRCDSLQSTGARVRVWDHRGIQVIAEKP